MRRAATVLRWRPEWPFTVLVVFAWIVLLVQATSPTSDGALGMQRSSQHVHFGSNMSDAGSWMHALAEWGLMTVAMMLPVTLPAVRHVAFNSIRPRRQRAMAVYITVFVGIWIGFGFAVLVLLPWLQRAMTVDDRAMLAAALAMAAIWQVSAFKRRAVFQCRRTVPLPPIGIRADAACAHFAWRQGLRCVISCWPLMVVMALAGFGGTVLMAALTALIMVEELTAFGPRLFGPSSAVLATVAATIALWK